MNGTFFMMMAAGARRVPPYKQRIAYLESTGTQWIDTGVYAPAGAAIETEFFLGNSGTYGIFGGRSEIPISTSTNTCTLFALSSGYFRFDRTGQTQIAFPYSLNTWYRFEYSGSSASITDMEAGTSTSVSIGTPTTFTSTPIALFGVNTQGTVGAMLKGRISCWRCRENGTLARDLIPVIDWNDRPAMYDQVSGRMFYNQGTGEFVIPPGTIPVDGQYGVWLKEGATVISSGMSMANVTVTRGQTQYVYNYGVISSTILSGLGQTGVNAAIAVVSGGGIARATTVLQGHMDVRSGGSAMSIEVKNNMYAAVYAGGYASGIITSNGYIDVNELAEDIVISRVQNGSGRLYIKSGGTGSGVIVGSGGRLTVSSGGTALAVTSNAGAFIAVLSGGYIEYA